MILTLTKFLQFVFYTETNPTRSPSRKPQIQFYFEIQACKPLPQTLWIPCVSDSDLPLSSQLSKLPEQTSGQTAWASWAEPEEGPGCPGQVRLSVTFAAQQVCLQTAGKQTHKK